jgi:CHAD domain-containing protein
MAVFRRGYAIPLNMSFQQIVRDLEALGYTHANRGIRHISCTYFDSQDGSLYSRGLKLRTCIRGTYGNSAAADSSTTWQLIRDGKLLLTQVTEHHGMPEMGAIADHIAGAVVPSKLNPCLECRMTEQEMDLHTPIQERDSKTEPRSGITSFHTEASEQSTLQVSKQVIEQVIQVRFENWRFKNPFRGAWSDQVMILMVVYEGEGSEADYLHTLLRDSLELVPLDVEPFERGLTLVDSSLPGVPVPDRYRLTPHDGVFTAIGKIVGKQAYKMWGNTDGTIHDLDIEFLHDLRVATRRARFALLLFRDCIGKARTEWLRKELSWIAKSLGRVRDIDVFQEKFSEQFRRIGASEELIEDVVGHYRGKRCKNLESMKLDLQSDRYIELLEGLRGLESSMFRKGQREGAPVVELIPGFIGEVLDRMSTWLHHAADSLSPSDLHDLRIEFKGLRYTTEFFDDLYAGEMHSVIRRFVRFQDCLGLFQDAQVAAQTLRKFSEKSMKKRAASVDVLLGVGGLIQVQREIQEQQQNQFLDMWHTFPRHLRKLRKLLQTNTFYTKQ